MFKFRFRILYRHLYLTEKNDQKYLELTCQMRTQNYQHWLKFNQ